MIVLAAWPAPTPVDVTRTPWVVVALQGELDIGALRPLGVLVEAVRAHPGSHVLVDLSDVAFAGSTALTAFAEARISAEDSGGTLTFHGASPFIQRLLEVWHVEPVSRGSAAATPTGSSSRLRLVPRPRDGRDERPAPSLF